MPNIIGLVVIAHIINYTPSQTVKGVVVTFYRVLRTLVYVCYAHMHMCMLRMHMLMVVLFCKTAFIKYVPTILVLGLEVVVSAATLNPTNQLGNIVCYAHMHMCMLRMHMWVHMWVHMYMCLRHINVTCAYGTCRFNAKWHSS